MIVAAGSETLRALGLVVAIPGVALSAGLVVFAATVHRGPQSEVLAVVRLAHRLAALAVVGAALEIAGVAKLFGEGWTDALTDHSPGALLRLLGAGLVVAGLFEPPDTQPGERGERWLPTGPGVFALAGAIVAVVSFGFDGHTVSRGPRVAHAVVDAVHVAAGAVWAGGVVGLVAVAWLRRRPFPGPALSLGELAHAFGRVATVALLAVVAAGVGLTLFVVERLGDVVDSPWGRRLLIKLAAVAVAAALGAYHHFRDVDPHRLRRTLAVEAAALVGVLVVTAFLVRASPQ